MLFKEAKRCLLNGYDSFFSKTVLLVKTSMYTLIKMASSTPILTSRMSLPTGTTISIQLVQIRPIKMDLSSALTVLLVIMYVLSLKVPLLVSNSGLTHSSIIFAPPMHLLILSKTSSVSFKLPARRKTLPIFAPLDAVSGSVLQVNAKLNLNPIQRSVYFLDLSHTQLATVFGIIVKQATLVKPIMSALMKV